MNGLVGALGFTAIDLEIKCPGGLGSREREQKKFRLLCITLLTLKNLNITSFIGGIF